MCGAFCHVLGTNHAQVMDIEQVICKIFPVFVNPITHVAVQSIVNMILSW
jgi:hypothetical protein